MVSGYPTRAYAHETTREYFETNDDGVMEMVSAKSKRLRLINGALGVLVERSDVM